MDLYNGDSIEWLQNQPDNSLSTVITGIPDLSEITNYLPDSIEAYKNFLCEIVSLLANKVKASEYIIFIQTDRRNNGEWIDKSFEITKTMEKCGVALRFHKIVCSSKIIDLYRVGYSHMLCFSKLSKYSKPFRDVIPPSQKLWANATPINPLIEIAQFLKSKNVNHVIDPFAGFGTVGLIMNLFGISSWNIELNPTIYTIMWENRSNYKFQMELVQLIKNYLHPY
jgi:adenine-specific DNA methylase